MKHKINAKSYQSKQLTIAFNVFNVFYEFAVFNAFNGIFILNEFCIWIGKRIRFGGEAVV